MQSFRIQVPSIVKLWQLLEQWFSTKDDFAPRGHLEVCEDILAVTLANGAAIGISWVETRDASKYPTLHKIVPTTKNYLDRNANSAEAEKSCSRAFLRHLTKR